VEREPSNAARGPADAFDQRPWARGWRRFVFPGVFLIYLGQTARGVGAHSSGVAAVGGYVILVAFCACYLFALAARWRVSERTFWVLYAVMVALCALEAVFAHEDAFVMLVFLSVLTISALGGRAVPIVAGFTLAAIFVPALIPSWDTGVDTNAAVAIPLVSLAMFGFFGVLEANRALSQARAEVARLAAENERNRIARDLHDLLGHSLTTITVKASLAGRLVDHEPARAAAEMAEVEELSRSALTDVRAAVASYREVTLAGEVAGGRELLQAVGIVAQLPLAVDVVDARYQELFGWVVREGLTNVVRHSRATRCSITLGRTWLDITDDGIAGGSPSPGSGLGGLRERVEAAGGTISAGPVRPVGWRLHVEMAAAQDAPAPAIDRRAVPA
jgi:two-component system sensor histidine kinase DesK